MVKVLLEQEINEKEYDHQIEIWEEVKKRLDIAQENDGSGEARALKEAMVREKKTLEEAKEQEKINLDTKIQLCKDNKARILRKAEAYQKLLKGGKVDLKRVLE